MTAITTLLTFTSSASPLPGGATKGGDSTPFSSVLDRLLPNPSPQTQRPKPLSANTDAPKDSESGEDGDLAADGGEQSILAAAPMTLPETASLSPEELGVAADLDAVDAGSARPGETANDLANEIQGDQQVAGAGSDHPANQDLLSANRPSPTIGNTAEVGIGRGETRAVRAEGSGAAEGAEHKLTVEPTPSTPQIKVNSVRAYSEAATPGGITSEVASSVGTQVIDREVDSARLSVVSARNDATADMTQHTPAPANPTPSAPHEARPVAPPSPTNGLINPQPARPELPLTSQVSHALTALKEASNGEHVMTIRVHPEEYGPLLVKAHIGGDKVRIDLVAPTVEARDILRASMADLRRELSTVQLQADVNVQTPSRSAADDQQLASGFAAREQSAGNQRGDGSPNEEPHNPHRRSPLAPRDTASSTGVDLFI